MFRRRVAPLTGVEVGDSSCQNLADGRSPRTGPIVVR
jgi:hypothetical protein